MEPCLHAAAAPWAQTTNVGLRPKKCWPLRLRLRNHTVERAFGAKLGSGTRANTPKPPDNKSPMKRKKKARINLQLQQKAKHN
jgi:hypothetical protein